MKDGYEVSTYGKLLARFTYDYGGKTWLGCCAKCDWWHCASENPGDELSDLFLHDEIHHHTPSTDTPASTDDTARAGNVAEGAGLPLDGALTAADLCTLGEALHRLNVEVTKLAVRLATTAVGTPSAEGPAPSVAGVPSGGVTRDGTESVAGGVPPSPAGASPFVSYWCDSDKHHVCGSGSACSCYCHTTTPPSTVASPTGWGSWATCTCPTCTQARSAATNSAPAETGARSAQEEKGTK